jgi:hypothetical protein
MDNYEVKMIKSQIIIALTSRAREEAGNSKTDY